MSNSLDDSFIDTHFEKQVVGDKLKEVSPEFSAVIYGKDHNPSPLTLPPDDNFHMVEMTDIPYDKELDKNKTEPEKTGYFSLSSYSLSSIATAATVAVSTAVVGLKVIPAIGKAISAGVQGAHQHFLESDPTDLETWRIHNYWAPFMSAAAGTGVVEVVKRVKGGVEDIDLESIIVEAEQYVAEADISQSKGLGGFSPDQRNTAQTWINDARTRLNTYISKHANSLDNILTPALSSSSSSNNTEQKDNDNAKAKDEKKDDAKKDEDKDKDKDEDKKKKSDSVVRKKVTIGSMLDIAKKAADARNPSKELLAKEDKELLSLIQALDALKTVPYLVSRLPSEKVEENIRNNPALGSREFISLMQSRARIVSRNLWVPPKDQNKKLMVAASGPGTGKSTTFKQAFEEWAGFPFRTMTGAEFIGIPIPENSTAFKLFASRIRKYVSEARMNGKRVKNLVIYGDDFDRAWSGIGIFAMDRESRRKLFSFFKDVCDPTISTISGSEPELFSYELAPGRLFPMDMSQVHFGISCNMIPPELLPETADSAMIDRMTNLNPAYADEQDRISIGIDFYLPNMLTVIGKFYGDANYKYNPNVLGIGLEDIIYNNSEADIIIKNRYDTVLSVLVSGPYFLAKMKTSDIWCLFCNQGKNYQLESKIDLNIQICYKSTSEIEVLRINKTNAIKTILEVVQADINMYTVKFGRKLGIRGLKDLMDRYAVYVESKLQRPQVEPDIFSFTDDGFELPKIVATIDGYNKLIDADMSGVEDAQLFNQKVSDERLVINSLPDTRKKQILAIFDKINETKDKSVKQTLFAEACLKSKLIRNRVTLPDPVEAGSKLTKAFGYFKSNGDVSGDIDRFPPILSVFEDIYWRMASFRRGIDRENKLIRIKFADPAAESNTLYTALSNVLGGVPVRYINNIDTLFENNDCYSISKTHPLYEQAIAGCKLTGKTSGKIYITCKNNGSVYVYLTYCSIPSTNTTVFYYTWEESNFVIKESALEVVLKHMGQGVLCPIKSTDTLELNTDDTISIELSRRLKQRICLLDSCFSTTLLDEKSSTEAFVVVKLTSSIRNQIQTWGITQGVSPDSIILYQQSLDKFQSYLYEKLNSDSWEIRGSKMIDPRSITIFLVHDTAGPNYMLDHSKLANDWLIGLPPIQGREQRARSAIETELHNINIDRLQQDNLLNQKSSAPIALNDSQEQILKKLMEFDLQLAQQFRDEGYKLSPTPLDQAVSEFISRLKSCTNSFGLVSEFPSEEIFKRTWVEFYTPEHTRINNVREQQRLAEEAQRRAEEQAAQINQIKLEAQLHAEAKLAFRKANQEVNTRDWKESCENREKEQKEKDKDKDKDNCYVVGFD
jgi:hypothetical protein